MGSIHKSRLFALTVTLAVVGMALFAYGASATHRVRKAVLRDVNKKVVGRIVFTSHRDGVLVAVSVSGLSAGFHGFHIHANNDPANGAGCFPPEAALPATFVSVDGHFNTTTGTHGMHSGDMPVLLAMTNGRAEASFVTDRFKLADIGARAVIVHAGSNNYGNIPVGTGPNDYTPGATALAMTQATGNAGARIVCGDIE